MYRTARRTYPARKTSTGPRANQFAGQCSICGLTVQAGAGLLEGWPGNWTVAHRPASWSGSPVSGWYVGGCPEDTAALNAKGGWGPESARTFVPPAQAELVWCETVNAPAHGNGPHLLQANCQNPHNTGTYAPVQAGPDSDLLELSRRAGGKYAYTASGARMTVSSQRCEDAPCCGCCD
jgi:hypothetical protein